MNIKAINLQTVRHDELPDCYTFGVMASAHTHTHRCGKVELFCVFSAKLPSYTPLCLSDDHVTDPVRVTSPIRADLFFHLDSLY